MGDNSAGQIGGLVERRLVPTLLTGTVADVAAGGYHTIFLRTNGTAVTLGENSSGQLGDGTFNSRITPYNLATDVSKIAAGGNGTAIIRTNGTLWMTGENRTGQLGDGTTTSRSSLVQVAAGVSRVSCADAHTLYVRDDGVMWGMGASPYGQLGDGKFALQEDATFSTPGVVQVSASSDSTYFVKSDGTLWAAGANDEGQLGDGTTADRGAAVLVATSVARVAAGYYHAIFVKTDGTLWSMGVNATGQLGDGTTTSRTRPVQVATGVGTGPGQIVAGGYHSLFIKSDRTLWAMGSNVDGGLGDGTRTNRLSPVQVATEVAWVAAGSQHSHFVRTDGSLWSMGSNFNGVLGDGTNTLKATPVQIASGVARVYSGASIPSDNSSHSLFVKTDGTLWAMGSNGYGQLGDGTYDNRNTPKQVATGVAQAAVGGYHSLFIKTDGSLWGVGANFSNQVAPGAGGDRRTPVQISTKVQSVSAGYDHTVFIRQTDSRMTNLSVRSFAATGAQTLIVGLSVGGSGQKPILIRGIGPTLTSFGVPGALADPQLRLFNSAGTQLQENNDWGGGATLTNAFAAAGAFPLPPTSKDAALLPSLAVGGYTVHVTSSAGTGVALMEAYDNEPLTSPARLVNVSTRTQVGSGADLLILGLTITGDGPKTVLIRAIGPTLADFGVSGVLADPQMEIYSGATRMLANDNWDGSPAMIAAFQSYGAFALLPGTRDAALVASLPPGGYTVQIRGAGNATGVALAEVYELP